MEHLALEIFDIADSKTSIVSLSSKYANLEPDASITLIDTSEIFGTGDVWSLPFTLNVNANAHIFGTAGELHGSRLHEQINKRKARLWVEGLPLFLGYLTLESEAEVGEDGNVNVTFESGQHTFDEMIEGAKANQVPMMSDVKFGVALWRDRWTCVNVKLEASAVFKRKAASRKDITEKAVITHVVDPQVIGDEDPQLTVFTYDGEDEGNSVQQYPRMVFPKGKFDNLMTGENDEEIDCLNTDYPYDENHPYCNTALCYQKTGYTVTKEENGTKTTYDDYSSEPTPQRGYEVMPANRVNSAPNFYVIYWIRALMKHLGIYIEENQMMEVEDLRRLFFVNTNCAYKEVKKLRSQEYDGSLGKYRFGSNGNLIAEYFGDLKKVKYGNTKKRYDGLKKITKIENCGLECKGYTAGRWMETVEFREVDVTDLIPEIDHIDIRVKDIAGMSEAVRAYYDGKGGNKSLAKNIFLHDAIATSECFPNVDIKEVISAIESGFGVRFLFSDDYRRVRIILLRNVFRNAEVQEIKCDIDGELAKTENSIRGFRMTYGNTEDTHFFYKGFDDLLPKKKPYFIDDSDKHDYSNWNLSAVYEELLDKVSAFDKTCYIDNETGNAYIIKVDKDAKRYDELHPSLFACADFMDAEDGDCTGEEETIKTINVGFSPAIMNDVNYEGQRGDNRTENQKFALFVDETMRPRRPDLGDLPNEEIQPGVESYNDSDAVYSVDELYERFGPKSDKKMTSDSVVQPGSFAITSDMSADKTGLSATLSFVYKYGLDEHQNHVEHVARCQITDLHVSGHLNEGYRLYLQDNYEPNDDGVCPVEKHDWGLTLGIMRGSGSDAHVDYSADPDDTEDNDTWDIVAGSNVTAHPDTCDCYGNLWDYKFTGKTGRVAAMELLEDMGIDPSYAERWRESDPDLLDMAYYGFYPPYNSGGNYPNLFCQDNVSIGPRKVMITPMGENRDILTYEQYRSYVSALQDVYESTSPELSYDERMQQVKEADSRNLLISWVGTYPSEILYQVWIYALDWWDRVIPNTSEGRFSLKLRAEKLNPYFDPTQPENDTTNRRYLEITNPSLCNRGLADQFYKEYSYWIRNARIANIPAQMELAELLAIDKTKRVKVGDITGFIFKRQFTVSNKTGLGNVTMGIMYI